MTLGPVELIAIQFPGNNFSGEIAPALADLVKSNTIRIIDFVFVMKDASGTLHVIELDDLDELDRSSVAALIDDVSGYISNEDVAQLGAALEPNSSELVVLFENIWAIRFASAVRAANGTVVVSERVPHDVIEAAEAFAN